MTATNSGGSRIEGVIFDIDGTLIDSVDLHAQAWQDAFAKFGKEVAFGAVREQIGKGGNELMPVFLSKQEIEQFGEELKAFRGDIFKSIYLKQIVPFPEVRNLMELIKKNGIRIGLGSSAHKDELDIYVELLNIADLLDATTSADDASRAKPHPDIFQSALGKLDIAPEKTLVIGDTPYDAEAALKAKLETIGFLCGGFESTKLTDAGVIDLYQDPADLLQRFSASRFAA